MQYKFGLTICTIGLILGSWDCLILLLAPMDLITMVNMRSLGATICLLSLGFYEKHRQKPQKFALAEIWQDLKQLKYLLLIYPMGPIAFVYGTYHNSVASMLVIASASPIIGSLLAYFILKQPMQKANWLAMIVIFFGISLVMGGDILNNQLLGSIASLVVAINFALLFIFQKKFPHINGKLIIGYAFLTAFIATLPFISWADWQIYNIFMVLFINGVIIVGGTFVLVSYASPLIRPEETLLLFQIELILSPILVWLFLGQIPPSTTFIGGAIITATLIIWVFYKLKKNIS